MCGDYESKCPHFIDCVVSLPKINDDESSHKFGLSALLYVDKDPANVLEYAVSEKLLEF